MKFVSWLILPFLFFLFIQPVIARQFTVGVSPPIIDIGERGVGSSEVIKFFIVTPSDEELLVKLESMKGSIDFFSQSKYKDLIFNFSEQDCSNYIDFLNNPVKLEPQNETLATEAGTIKGWREIGSILEIPEDSEPGYHTITIRPVPYVPPGYNIGVNIVALTTVTVLFKIPGDAIREGKILDILTGSHRDGLQEIDILFHNSGTTTISARASSIEVYDKNGELINTLTSGSDHLKPGETKPLKAYLPTKGLDLGYYDVYADVDYTTGKDSKQSTIELKAVEEPEEVELPTPGISLWLLLILIVIAVITYLIYRRV